MLQHQDEVYPKQLRRNPMIKRVNNEGEIFGITDLEHCASEMEKIKKIRLEVAYIFLQLEKSFQKKLERKLVTYLKQKIKQIPEYLQAWEQSLFKLMNQEETEKRLHKEFLENLPQQEKNFRDQYFKQNINGSEKEEHLNLLLQMKTRVQQRKRTNHCKLYQTYSPNKDVARRDPSRKEFKFKIYKEDDQDSTGNNQKGQDQNQEKEKDQLDQSRLIKLKLQEEQQRQTEREIQQQEDMEREIQQQQIQAQRQYEKQQKILEIKLQKFKTNKTRNINFYSEELFLYLGKYLLIIGNYYYFVGNNYKMAEIFFLKGKQFCKQIRGSMNPCHIRLKTKTNLLLAKLYYDIGLHEESLSYLWENVTENQIEIQLRVNQQREQAKGYHISKLHKSIGYLVCTLIFMTRILVESQKLQVAYECCFLSFWLVESFFAEESSLFLQVAKTREIFESLYKGHIRQEAEVERVMRIMYMVNMNSMMDEYQQEIERLNQQKDKFKENLNMKGLDYNNPFDNMGIKKKLKSSTIQKYQNRIGNIKEMIQNAYIAVRSSTQLDMMELGKLSQRQVTDQVLWRKDPSRAFARQIFKIGHKNLIKKGVRELIQNNFQLGMMGNEVDLMKGLEQTSRSQLQSDQNYIGVQNYSQNEKEEELSQNINNGIDYQRQNQQLQRGNYLDPSQLATQPQLRHQKEAHKIKIKRNQNDNLSTRVMTTQQSEMPSGVQSPSFQNLADYQVIVKPEVENQDQSIDELYSQVEDGDIQHQERAQQLALKKNQMEDRDEDLDNYVDNASLELNKQSQDPYPNPYSNNPADPFKDIQQINTSQQIKHLINNIHHQQRFNQQKQNDQNKDQQDIQINRNQISSPVYNNRSQQRLQPRNFNQANKSHRANRINRPRYNNLQTSQSNSKLIVKSQKQSNTFNLKNTQSQKNISFQNSKFNFKQKNNQTCIEKPNQNHENQINRRSFNQNSNQQSLKIARKVKQKAKVKIFETKPTYNWFQQWSIHNNKEKFDKEAKEKRESLYKTFHKDLLQSCPNNTNSLQEQQSSSMRSLFNVKAKKEENQIQEQNLNKKKQDNQLCEFKQCISKHALKLSTQRVRELRDEQGQKMFVNVEEVFQNKINKIFKDQHKQNSSLRNKKNKVSVKQDQQLDQSVMLQQSMGTPKTPNLRKKGSAGILGSTSDGLLLRKNMSSYINNNTKKEEVTFYFDEFENKKKDFIYLQNMHTNDQQETKLANKFLYLRKRADKAQDTKPYECDDHIEHDMVTEEIVQKIFQIKEKKQQEIEKEIENQKLREKFTQKSTKKYVFEQKQNQQHHESTQRSYENSSSPSRPKGDFNKKANQKTSYIQKNIQNVQDRVIKQSNLKEEKKKKKIKWNLFEILSKHQDVIPSQLIGMARKKFQKDPEYDNNILRNQQILKKPVKEQELRNKQQIHQSMERLEEKIGISKDMNWSFKERKRQPGVHNFKDFTLELNKGTKGMHIEEFKGTSFKNFFKFVKLNARMKLEEDIKNNNAQGRLVTQKSKLFNVLDDQNN